MNNENTETVKSVSAGSIILYLISISLIVSGITTFNVAIILAGVILLPIVNTLSQKYFKIKFSGLARFIIAVIILGVGATVTSSLDSAREKMESTPQQQIQTEDSFELGMYEVESSEFAYIDPKEVNVWKSYSDRTLVGKIEQGDEVEVIAHDQANDYCKITAGNITGWIACGWLQKTSQ